MIIFYGKITGIHGLKGEVEVAFLDKDYFTSLPVLNKDIPIIINNQTFTVLNVKKKNKAFVLALKDIDDIEQAKAFIGADIFIDSSFLPQLDDDTFYEAELIEYEIIDLDNNLYGKVVDVYSLPSNYVLEIKLAENDEIVSIPFVHRGAIEGKIANADDTRMFGYQISALNKDNKEIVSTFADIDGFFILDGIPYGTYKVIVSKDGNQLAELQDIKVDDISVYIKDEIKLDTRALAFFETKDTQEEFEQLEDLHKQGYNNVDYRNRDFPIDIPQAVLNPEKDMPHIQIEEIEKDIFVEVKAPVFDSVASVQSFERYSTIQDIETDVFSQSEGNLATVLQDLQYNTALAKALTN